MKHVIVLDSDPSTRVMLTDLLGQNAIRVTPIAESNQLQRLLSNEIVDALLVEVNTDHGVEVVRDLAILTDAPILIVSEQRTAEEDRVQGLEAGATDYICRPFGNRELVARLKVAMRDKITPRIERDRRSYRFSGYELLVHQRLLRRPERDEVGLTSAEFNLLSAFLVSPRQSLSRERLLAASRVHSGEVFDRSLDAVVLRLRRKIERDPTKPQLIRTARGAGYRFDSDVEFEERPKLKR